MIVELGTQRVLASSLFEFITLKNPVVTFKAQTTHHYDEDGYLTDGSSLTSVILTYGKQDGEIIIHRSVGRSHRMNSVKKCRDFFLSKNLLMVDSFSRTVRLSEIDMMEARLSFGFLSD